MLERLEPLTLPLARYRLQLLALSALIAASTLLEGAGIGLLFPLLDYIQGGASFAPSGASRRVLETISLLGMPPTPGGLIGALFAAISATLAFKFLITRATAAVCNPYMKDLRDAAFGAVITSDLSTFHAGTSGRLVQTLEDDVEYAGQALSFAVTAAGQAATLAILGAALFLVSWKLSLLVAAIAALRYTALGLFIRSRRALAHEHSGLRARLKSHLIAIHQGIDVVKTFGGEDAEKARFAALSGEMRDNATALAGNAAAGSFSEGLLGDGVLCLLVYLAVSRLGVSGAPLLAFLVVISRVIPKVAALNDARIRIAEYLSRIAWLPQALAPAGLPRLRWGSRALPELKDKIAFNDVSFAYPGAREPALQGVTLTLGKNETLAVVGPTGSGKTTLARLLLRLFDPTSGTVAIDGVPLSELRREDWTRLVGVVSQDTFIFDDTLENNVKYGAPHCSEAEFRQALKRARAEGFVSALPQKEKTRLGERGVTLSGGERQRIAIARAFLRQSPILILDEATSALDAETERQIQESVEELTKERTVLVIAHRFTTIRGARRIAVLSDGRLAELGTHEELMSQGRLYRRFRELQAL